MAETSISGIEFKIVGSTSKAKTAVDKLTSSLKELKTALSSAHTAKLEKELEGIDKNAKKSTTTLGKLFKSIGRIGFYRAIRSALKFITEGFREGLQNAYQFSKMVGYELAGTMDTLATKSLTMKNQLGSAFGGLIMAVEPILLQLIALVTRAANAIAQLMAIIGGKSTYLKAIDTVKEYGAAVGGAGQAAKEAMRYLAPFDELNVLPSDNGGGGGGGASTPDYSAMFEETPVSQALQDFAADFKITVSDVLFDWSDLTGEQIAEKALSGLFMLTGAGVGFILGGVPGALWGSLIGLGLSLIADTFIFDHDGVLEPNEIAHGLQYVLNALAGGVIGFLIGGPGGAIIGASIGLGLSLLANAAEFLPSSKHINTDVLLDQLTTALGMLVGGVIGFFVGGPAGALIGATIGLGVTAALTSIKFDTQGGELVGESGRTGLDYFVVDVLGLPTNEEWKTYGENIWKKIKDGVNAGWKSLKDGWIDFKTELYNIFIKPIVDAFDEFAEKHPKIASLLGFENGSSDVLAPGAAAGESMWGGTFELDAEVTDIKDSIPKEKKTIKDFFADLFGTKDSIPSDKKNVTGVKAVLGSTDDTKLTLAQKAINKVKAIFGSTDETELTVGQKIINGIKGFFGSTDQSKLPETEKTVSGLTGSFSKTNTANLTDAQKTIPSIAQFNSMMNNLVKDKIPTIPSKANLNDSKNSLTGNSKPVVPTTANFDARKTGDLDKVINTTANFTKRKTGSLDKVINTVSNFTKRKTKSLDKVIDTVSNFTSWWDSFKSSPVMDAIASFFTWRDDIPENQKYIEMSASIIGIAGQSGYNAEGAVYMNGVKRPVTMMASGGILRNTPQLFVARESGPELVGTLKGHTAVMNNDQIVASVSAGVARAIAGIQFHLAGFHPADVQTNDGYDYDAIYQAVVNGIRDSGVGDEEITLDGDVLYRKMVQRNQMNTRMTGRNVMATA